MFLFYKIVSFLADLTPDSDLSPQNTYEISFHKMTYTTHGASKYHEIFALAAKIQLNIEYFIAIQYTPTK